ncbi:MAG TPA: helix-turn-helix transcriptional regulator [Candidatus Egerieimonas intestinavium]|uniref:Helix-turn-helix transcriptional regulator n=1 Tax=Candidatus Egerieimonas intestinavium TaxID=2840777 RepID=A0A9D1ELJ6_9FIRM|nr:helix-turn-helix transcriptional regulator [Candidatus Egerieimonas intestinavium]
MYNDFQIISSNIKYLREKKGYTQEQLAEAADLSVSHLSKVESGQRRMGMKAYLTVLKALEVCEADYVNLASAPESDHHFRKYTEIMKDCSKSEQRFLLETLRIIKDNMGILKGSNQKRIEE